MHVSSSLEKVPHLILEELFQVIFQIQKIMLKIKQL